MGSSRYWNMIERICESAATVKRKRTTPNSRHVVAENLRLSWLIAKRTTMNSNTEAIKKIELKTSVVK
jgi:hypothetical protein